MWDTGMRFMLKNEEHMDSYAITVMKRLNVTDTKFLGDALDHIKDQLERALKRHWNAQVAAHRLMMTNCECCNPKQSALTLDGSLTLLLMR